MLDKQTDINNMVKQVDHIVKSGNDQGYVNTGERSIIIIVIAIITNIIII